MTTQEHSANRQHSNIWRVIIECCSVIAIIILVSSLSSSNKELKQNVKALEEAKDKVTLCEADVEKYKSMINLDNVKTNVHSEVEDWAFKRAKKWVPRTVVREILREAKKYHNYIMIVAVFTEESAFDQYARSTKQAKGLGQIMTSVWLETLQKEGLLTDEVEIFDIKKNIAATDYVLTTYKAEKGSWRKALSAYVNGDGAYVTRVLSNFAELSLLISELEGVNPIAVILAERKNAENTETDTESR